MTLNQTETNFLIFIGVTLFGVVAFLIQKIVADKEKEASTFRSKTDNNIVLLTKMTSELATSNELTKQKMEAQQLEIEENSQDIRIIYKQINGK